MGVVAPGEKKISSLFSLDMTAYILVYMK